MTAGTKKLDKITLDLELKDLIDIVSKSKKAPVSEILHSHAIEAEELKKAWFRHVLISMEKLGDNINEIRTLDINNLRNELRNELLVTSNRLEKRIERLENKVDDNEKIFEDHKDKVFNPLNDKITTLTAKLATFAVIAGLAGTGIVNLIIWVVKEYVFTKGTP